MGARIAGRRRHLLLFVENADALAIHRLRHQLELADFSVTLVRDPRSVLSVLEERTEIRDILVVGNAAVRHWWVAAALAIKFPDARSFVIATEAAHMRAWPSGRSFYVESWAHDAMDALVRDLRARVE